VEREKKQKNDLSETCHFSGCSSFFRYEEYLVLKEGMMDNLGLYYSDVGKG
jgi:hypothetical protein